MDSISGESAMHQSENEFAAEPIPEKEPVCQTVVVGLERAGLIRRNVFHAGCGAGDGAIYLAKRGYRVWGVDRAAAAIGMARAKAAMHDVEVAFFVSSRLCFLKPCILFDTVIDTGFFQRLDQNERSLYMESLRQITSAGSLFHLLFTGERRLGSDRVGRLTTGDLLRLFKGDWEIKTVRPAQTASRLAGPYRRGTKMLLATIDRIAKTSVRLFSTPADQSPPRGFGSGFLRASRSSTT